MYSKSIKPDVHIYWNGEVVFITETRKNKKACTIVYVRYDFMLETVPATFIALIVIVSLIF